MIAALLWAVGLARAGEQVAVAASGLRLRQAPDAEAPYAVKVPYGAPVEVLGVTLPVEVDGALGRWAEVRYGEHTGFVFDRWLAPAPPADCRSLSDWAAALGEPIKTSVRVVDDCECASRSIQERRSWADGSELVLEEIWGGVREHLVLPGDHAGLPEGWLIARACLAGVQGAPPTRSRPGVAVSEGQITIEAAGVWIAAGQRLQLGHEQGAPAQ